MEGERRKRRRKRSAPKKKREAEGMERGERGDRKSVLRGQSSPGSLQSGQDPSKGILQIPHVSVGSSVHDQDATVCQFFTLTFIIDDECCGSNSLGLACRMAPSIAHPQSYECCVFVEKSDAHTDINVILELKFVLFEMEQIFRMEGSIYQLKLFGTSSSAFGRVSS